MEKDEYYIDLDGTLAEFREWTNALYIGPPVPAMVERVKAMIKRGESVVIFTARLAKEKEGESDPFNKDGFSQEQIVEAIENWCLKHVGQKLRVTNEKRNVTWGYDDRFSRIIKNTGLTLEEHIDLILDNAMWKAHENPTISAGSLIRFVANEFERIIDGHGI